MSSPLQPPIDIKPDPRGSPFLYSPDSLQSPQSSQNPPFALQSQAGDVNDVLLARLYGAHPCAPKPEPDGFHLYFQDSEGVQLLYVGPSHSFEWLGHLLTPATARHTIYTLLRQLIFIHLANSR